MYIIFVFLTFHNFKRLNYYIDYDCNIIIFSLLQNLLSRIDLK